MIHLTRYNCAICHTQLIARVLPKKLGRGVWPVEDLNVITDLKCNKLLNVITFGLKCNKLQSVTTFGLK